MRDGQPLILLLDDDADDRALARLVLERELPRVAVEEIADATAFARACGKRSFDLVILELKLRWADGLAVLAALREDWPQVPVILLTRFGNEEAAVRAVRLGAAEYLPKQPAGFLRLPLAVQAALDRERAGPAPGAAPLAALLDRAQFSVFSATPEGRLLNASPGFLQLLGVADLESANRLDLEPFLAAAASQDGAGAKAAGTEVRLRRADGQSIWVEVIGTVVRTGGTTRIDGLVEDVTARKTADDETARRSAQLRQANEELLQFASMASHELQEPVRMMERYTQLLKEDYKEKLGSDGDELVDFVIGAARRLRLLIEDLLALSRVESRERRTESTRLEDLLEQALGNLQAPHRGAAARRSPARRCRRSRSSRPRSSRCFRICSTIRSSSTARSRPKAHVSARKEGREWVFSVRDNGIGIDPAEVEAIFAIFKRLHSQIPGTGVGLAICKKIVERHGGRIWAESTPGRGSTFFFTLPAA